MFFFILTAQNYFKFKSCCVCIIQYIAKKIVNKTIQGTRIEGIAATTCRRCCTICEFECSGGAFMLPASVVRKACG